MGRATTQPQVGGGWGGDSHAWVSTFHLVPDTGAVGKGSACSLETQNIDLV